MWVAGETLEERAVDVCNYWNNNRDAIVNGNVVKEVRFQKRIDVLLRKLVPDE